MNVQITLVICEVEEDTDLKKLAERVEAVVAEAYKYNTVVLAHYEEE